MYLNFLIIIHTLALVILLYWAYKDFGSLAITMTFIIVFILEGLIRVISFIYNNFKKLLTTIIK